MVVTKQTAKEILDAALDDKRIAVIVPSREAGFDVILEIVELIDLPLSEYKIYRSRQEIHFKHSVGRVTVHSIRSTEGMRGMSLDRVYIEEGLDTPELLAGILPVLDVRGGELIRYTRPVRAEWDSFN